MKALVGAFNQEKALVGAFSVIVQLIVEPMEHCTALVLGRGGGGVERAGGGEEVEPQLGGEAAPAHRQVTLQLPPAGATADTSSQPGSGNSGQHLEA